MKTFQIRFSAHWMGGIAIVRAETELLASAKLVEHHEAYQKEKDYNPEQKEFKITDTQEIDNDAVIVYYYDGDY